LANNQHADWRLAALHDYIKLPNGTTWSAPGITIEEAEINAARIVACVNACSGIPNEALEAGVIEELAEAGKAFTHMEEAYELWRTDEDDQFWALAKAEGYECDGIGHEYLEDMRANAITMAQTALAKLQQVEVTP
jgi:hypothetical protein